MPIITLTTDFGMSDAYVGVMKGVILTIAPHVTLVDISHEVPAQDVLTASFLLYQAELYFPPDTIHIAVVDPGVGSERRALAARTNTGIFLAPDNGVLTCVLMHSANWEAYSITNAEYWLPVVSATFHGRDIFAPVGAHLARGLPISYLGKPVDDPVLLTLPVPDFKASGEIIAHVFHIDRFGNLVLDIKAEQLPEIPVFELAGHRIEGLRRTYADGVPDALIAYVGSTRHHVEIALPGGDAARVTGAQIGTPVSIHNGEVTKTKWTNS